MKELIQKLEAISITAKDPSQSIVFLDDCIALVREAFEGKTLVPDDDIEFLGQCFTIPNGCGDNSCLIKPTSGAGTNGGCRCDSNRALVNIVFARWQTARTRVKSMLAASAGEE